MKRSILLIGLPLFVLARDVPQVSITVAQGQRVIASNGIPNHNPGRFPNRNNPNTISAQSYTFQVPVKPEVAAQPTGSRHAFFGVAINGVPYEPGTAEFWNYDPSTGWVYEAMSGKINLGLDDSNAHVQPTGAYHYHGLPTGLIASLGGDGKVMRLVGYAADGFPIYTSYAHSDPMNASSPLKIMRSSYQVKAGNRPSGPQGKHDGTFTADYEYVAGSGDLDECNGRTGITPEYPEGTFYYCITAEFPQLSRLWKGTPDASFEKGGGGPPGGGRGGPPGGGQQGRGRRPGGGGPPGGMRGGSPPNPFEAPPFPPR